MADGTAFFYGTLMVPKILYRVCFGTTAPQPHQTQFIRIRPALLPAFRRHKVKGADYPGIVPAAASDPPASVLGTYVTGLTPQDLARLDRFEGGEYERRTVEVEILRGGKTVGAGEAEVDGRASTQTYVYLDPRDLEEREWDFDEFKREKMGAWTLEDSAEYDDVPCDQQTDGTRGRGAGGEITKQLEADKVEQAKHAAV